jgi:hypothetical protein
MALCRDRVGELAIRPVTPMSVNSPGPIADLAASVTEIKRGLRQGQGDFKVNGGRQAPLFTHCDPGAGQNRVEEVVLPPQPAP